MAPKKAAAKPVAKKAAPKAGDKKGSKAKKEETSAKPAPSLFDKRPKNWGIGQDLPPKRDLTRYVRWPKYIKRQRQKRVLQKRLRIPPAINQFNMPVDTHLKKEIFKFALKYKPETKQERFTRLKKEAADKVKGGAKAKKAVKTKPFELKFGIQRVTRYVEQKRAKLVLIAHDVTPVEMIVWLPALCKKMEVPYCIVKGKSNIGKLVGYKTASCAAFLHINASDKPSFDKMLESVKISFNDRYDDLSRRWGGLSFSRKSKQNMAKKRKEALKA